MSDEWIRYYDGQGERARVPADDWERLVRSVAEAGEAQAAEALRHALAPARVPPPPPAPSPAPAPASAPRPPLELAEGSRTLTVTRPVWTRVLPEVAERLPAPSPRAFRVAILGLDDRRPEARRSDGMARVVPLYLAESLGLDTTAEVLCVLPIEDGAWADRGAASLEEMLAVFRPGAAPDAVVGGRLRAVPGASLLELEVWEVARVRRLAWMRLPALGHRFRGALVRAERRIGAAIADVGGLRQRDDGLHRPPSWTSGDLRLACLGRLVGWILAAPRGMAGAEPLRPDTLAPFLELVERSGAAPVPTWMAAAAARLALRSGSPGAAHFALEVTRRLCGAGEAPLARQLEVGRRTAISAV